MNRLVSGERVVVRIKHIVGFRSNDRVTTIDDMSIVALPQKVSSIVCIAFTRSSASGVEGPITRSPSDRPSLSLERCSSTQLTTRLRTQTPSSNSPSLPCKSTRDKARSRIVTVILECGLSTVLRLRMVLMMRRRMVRWGRVISRFEIVFFEIIHN